MHREKHQNGAGDRLQFYVALQKDVNAIVALLNVTTRHLHERGIAQWKYPWDIDPIAGDVRRRYVFFGLWKGKIVATFSMRGIEQSNCCWLSKGSRYLYRIAVHPDYQGRGVGRAVIDEAKAGIQQGEELYLDCWQGNRKLREFYEEQGFELVGEFPEEEYTIAVYRFGR